MSAALCFCAVCVHMMRVLFCDNGRKIGIILYFFKFRQCMSDNCHAQPQVIIPCADQAFALCRWRMCHMLFSILRKKSVYITQSDILHLPFLPPSKKTIWECQICLSCYHMNAIISFILWWCISVLLCQSRVLFWFWFFFKWGFYLFSAFTSSLEVHIYCTFYTHTQV